MPAFVEADGGVHILVVDVGERVSKFLGRDGGGAEFADDDAGGGVGEDHGIRQGRAGGNGQRKNAENGVACAGNVEDLAAGGAAFNAELADARVSDFKAGGGNVNMAGRRFLDEAHTVFAAGDDHGSAAKVGEQRAASFFDGLLGGEGASDEEACFLGVADDGARTAIGVEAGSLGLDENGYVERMACAKNAVGKIVGD